jgi:hypothetical protein
MLAWNDEGEGFVMQVSTPSWPASGNSSSPRKDGNTLGCVTDNNVKVSQHFFALRLNKDDLAKVLAALQNASVVTDPANPQIVRNGGPSEVQDLVKKLGKKSASTTRTRNSFVRGRRDFQTIGSSGPAMADDLRDVGRSSSQGSHVVGYSKN